MCMRKEFSVSSLIARILSLFLGSGKRNYFVFLQLGELSSELVLYDIMIAVKYQIHTICGEMVASKGTILFLSRDERYILPQTRVNIHDPLISSRVVDIAQYTPNITRIFVCPRINKYCYWYIL